MLFLVYRVWGETIFTKSSEIIILDTNVCTITLKLFNNLIEEIHRQNPSEAKLNYNDVWARFKRPSSVDRIMNEYLSEADQIKSKSSIAITKQILDLKSNRPKVVFLVPVFVYNEAVNGLSSKISKGIGIKIFPQYVDFFKSIPIKTTVEIHEFIEDKDYPRKNVLLNDTLPVMKEFLSNAIQSNHNLEELFKYLKEDNFVKRTQTEHRLRDLFKVCVNVKNKIRLWNGQIKAFLSNNGVKDYTTETDQFATIIGKITSYATNINFDDVIDAVAYRLIKSKEEFDFFDLQIYLYAKEKDAFILTINTQAIQEIIDPVFLGFFENMKILNPNINFKHINDLDKPSDCKTLMESAIRNDFKNDHIILNKLESIFNLHREVLNATLLNPIFRKFFIGIEQELVKGKELKTTLSETPLFDALDLLKEVNGRLKIDQQVLFATATGKVILRQINAMNYIDENIFNSTLTIDDFIKPMPTIDFVPKIARFDRGLAEGVKKGLNNENHNLKEFLNIFRDENKSVRITALKYARILYFESNFNHISLEKAVDSFLYQ